MFTQGFEKVAGARSEILNTTVNPLNWAINPFAYSIGAAVGPHKKEDRKKVDEKSWSNLIPGVAPFRLGRRSAANYRESEE